MKTNKMLKRIMTLSLITGSIMYASSFLQCNHTMTQKTYHDMSIVELQEEVEELSQHGDLPFDMGLELMKRWTQKS